MNLLALVFIFIGTLMHVLWNFFAKSARDKLAFLWLALLGPSFGGVCLLSYHCYQGSLGLPAVVCILLSGSIHIFYFYFLARAYQSADLSFAYPYARGLGALLATGTEILFLVSGLSFWGYLGVTLTLLATLIEPLSIRRRGVKRGPLFSKENHGLIFTLLTGVSIGAYTLVDKVGVAHLHPMSYLLIYLMIPTVIFTPLMTMTGRGLLELKKSHWRPMGAGLLLSGGYFLVLLAMKGAPVSYVIAARTMGIILSDVFGVVWFSEKIAPARWVSMALVALGLACLSLA